jgi:hypothetical protein
MTGRRGFLASLVGLVLGACRGKAEPFNFAPDNLAGPKPMVFGRVYNMPAVCVDERKLTYQVNDGPVAAITAVRDNGQDLLAGDWLSYPESGYFRLGTTPKGVVTADVVAYGSRRNWGMVACKKETTFGIDIDPRREFRVVALRAQDGDRAAALRLPDLARALLRDARS